MKGVPHQLIPRLLPWDGVHGGRNTRDAHERLVQCGELFPFFLHMYTKKLVVNLSKVVKFKTYRFKYMPRIISDIP